MKAAWKALVVGALTTSVAFGAVPAAGADQLGYIVNVTMRPTYNFPNAQAALDYGYGLCGRIEAKHSYADMAQQIKTDFRTNDEFTVSYLLSQASQELCPGQIWQLRQSSAGYTGT